MDFSVEDVKKVAQALLEDHTWFDNSDCGREQYSCEYCSAISPPWSKPDEIEKLKHDLDCPVLAARDLLTRIEEI